MPDCSSCIRTQGQRSKVIQLSSDIDPVILPCEMHQLGAEKFSKKFPMNIPKMFHINHAAIKFVIFFIDSTIGTI